MKKFKGGYVVIIGCLLLTVSLFLPHIKGEGHTDTHINGWFILLLEMASLFEIGKDAFTKFLASLFVTNILFLGCVFTYPFVKNGAAKALLFLSVILSILFFFIPFYFSDISFSVGYYLWLGGMILVSCGWLMKILRPV